MTEIGRTLLILSPWDSPAMLKRAWCLYEISCSNPQGLAIGISGNQVSAVSSNFSFDIAQNIDYTHHP